MENSPARGRRTYDRVLRAKLSYDVRSPFPRILALPRRTIHERSRPARHGKSRVPPRTAQPLLVLRLAGTESRDGPPARPAPAGGRRLRTGTRLLPADARDPPLRLLDRKALRSPPWLECSSSLCQLVAAAAGKNPRHPESLERTRAFAEALGLCRRVSPVTFSSWTSFRMWWDWPGRFGLGVSRRLAARATHPACSSVAVWGPRLERRGAAACPKLRLSRLGRVGKEPGRRALPPRARAALRLRDDSRRRCSRCHRLQRRPG